MATKKSQRKITTPQVTLGIGDAVESAFSDAEELQNEMRDWYDNLPENFQNSDKGSEISEAADALENVEQPEVPDDLSLYNVSYIDRLKRRPSRANRLASCVTRVEAAADKARERITDLGSIIYDTEGKLKDDQGVEDAPPTENERDEIVTDLEEFADACENAVSEWENVTFPGMYG